jgi:hypothetical protein
MNLMSLSLGACDVTRDGEINSLPRNNVVVGLKK